MAQINTTYKYDQTFDIQKIKKQLGIVELPILKAMRKGRRLDKTGIDWYEDELVSFKTTGYVGGGDITASATVIDVANNIFAVGDIVEVDDERMKVTAVDLANSKITVIRGFQGTTAATHTAGSTLEIVSSVVNEGGLLSGSQVSKPIKSTNVTQIFQDKIELSGSAEASSPDWVKDEIDRQMKNKLYRLMKLKARSVLYGIKYDSTADEERTMGGLNYFIGNKINVGAALTPDVLIDQIVDMETEGVFDVGLRPQIWLNPVYQKVVNTWYDSKLLIERKDNQYGQVIMSLVTNAGTIDIKYDNQIKVGDVFIVDMVEIEERPLRPQAVVKLAKNDDKTKRMIVEECTVVVNYSMAWRKLENISAP